MSYNGWANHETWLVAVWIDNDEKLLDRVIAAGVETAQTCIENDEHPVSTTRHLMVQYLEDLFTDMLTDGQPAIVCDFVGSALANVDWRTLAPRYTPTIYAVGSNMPGYMPDEVPALVIGFDEAVQICREYVMEDDEDLDEAEVLLGLKTDESYTTANRVHWIVEATE
jgi:hypothetical protein